MCNETCSEHKETAERAHSLQADRDATTRRRNVALLPSLGLIDERARFALGFNRMVVAGELGVAHAWPVLLCKAVRGEAVDVDVSPALSVADGNIKRPCLLRRRR